MQFPLLPLAMLTNLICIFPLSFFQTVIITGLFQNPPDLQPGFLQASTVVNDKIRQFQKVIPVCLVFHDIQAFFPGIAAIFHQTLNADLILRIYI